MSVKVMGKVWELDLPHNQLLVLLSLADHADHEGNNVYPSLGLTAWKTGYSIQQVRRVMRELEKSGVLIAITRKAGTKTKYRIDTSAGKVKPDYTPSKMSPVTKSNDHPLHFVTSTPYIPPDDSTGINHPLEPSSNLSSDDDAQVSKSEKPKKERQPNAIFDAVALGSFQLTQVNGDKTLGARIGKIVAWLKGQENVTAERVAQFYTWYSEQNETASAPRDVSKFAEWWMKFASTGMDDDEKWFPDTMEFIGGKPW